MSPSRALDAFLHAVEVFGDRFAELEWRWLAVAVACHLLKTACRSRAWRNIVATAYPDARVRWRDLYGAYVAGVGVNALLPARGGDLVKLYLARRRIEGATYATLASTFAVETLFDLAASLALIAWALQRDALPGLDVIPDLPAFDLNWVIRNPTWAALAATGLATLVGFVAWRAAGRLAALRRRLGQGLAVLGSPRRYLTTVVTWQAADWGLRIAELHCFLRAFGIDVGLDGALLVQVTQSLSTVVPLTPGGIGTEQALVVYVLHDDAPTSALLSFSVGMKLSVIAVNVAVGFTAIGLMLRTLRWRRHVERAGPDT
ncbi:MAG: flippase-like domain-containing protein [Thermoleophilia bacterium]|nr:flippase-like domain-containing protein [Thermoleophilia bacterium]